VSAEGLVVWQANRYSVPWRLIGRLLAVRITAEELIVYGPDLAEVARHRLLPAHTQGQRSIQPEHQPVVNAAEAERVRAIFALYRKHQALGPVVQELARRGWVQKRWRTRKGRLRGGRPFTTTSLQRLLTNVTYRGQIRYHDEVHPGEHPALVDATLWDQVQALLRRSRTTHGLRIHNPHGSFLQGILHCVPCGCVMTATSSTKGTRCYRYYVCRAAQRHGWKNCPAPAVSAGTIEQVVLEQLQALDGFATLWPRQGPDEQARLMQRLLERVDYDRVQGKLTITLQADHATSLAQAQAQVGNEANP
jgi:hypothetical protein